MMYEHGAAATNAANGRMADHDGCATVTMRVVRWVHSRKDPVLPEPRSQSPQHSRTILSLNKVERLLSENVNSTPAKMSANWNAR